MSETLYPLWIHIDVIHQHVVLLNLHYIVRQGERTILYDI